MKKQQRNYWFRAKRYGWGWYPASWQGWATMAVYITCNIYLFRDIDTTSHSVSDTLMNFVPTALILVVLLIGVCYKTGEKPRWRWGK